MNLRWRWKSGLREMACAMALLSCVVSWSGCGVKSTESNTSTEQPGASPGSANTTPVLVTLTSDTSSSNLVSMFANISLVQITPRNGGASTLYSGSSNLELTHLAGSSQYLTMANLSQNTYKNLLVTFNNPLVTYIDDKGETITESAATFTGVAEGDFSDLVTVGTTPLEINIDLNLQKSVVVDPTTGALTLTPTLVGTVLPITSGTQEIGTGLLEGVLGTVTNYTGSLLTMSTDVAQDSVTCNITGATTAVNYMASAGLIKGELLRVDMSAQSNSSLNCTRIEAINSSNVGYAMAGTVNSHRGTMSPYQMTLVMQEGSGAGVSPEFMGGGINANFDSANFAIDWDGMDQTNLGFTPVFSASTFFSGQYVEASALVPLLTSGNDVGAIPGSMITVAAMNAEQMTLRKQEEEGTVSNVSTASNGVTNFQLTLPVSSIFAQYTADPTAITPVVATINVIVPASVTVDGSLTTPVVGSAAGALPYVKVRGLLFRTGSSYTMVAQRVTEILAPSYAVVSTVAGSGRSFVRH